MKKIIPFIVLILILVSAHAFACPKLFKEVEMGDSIEVVLPAISEELGGMKPTSVVPAENGFLHVHWTRGETFGVFAVFNEDNQLYFASITVAGKKEQLAELLESFVAELKRSEAELVDKKMEEDSMFWAFNCKGKLFGISIDEYPDTEDVFFLTVSQRL